MSTAAPPAGLNGLLSAGIKRHRVREALAQVGTAKSVLDLGCGLCEIAFQLPADVEYIGVERDPWMVDRARQLLPGRTILQADLEAEEFDPGRRAERILLVAVWEHLARPADLLRRAPAWLAPGGRLVLTTPAPAGAFWIELGSRLGLLSRHADDEHERLWSAQEVERAAAACGWTTLVSRRFLGGLNQLVVLGRQP